MNVSRQIVHTYVGIMQEALKYIVNVKCDFFIYKYDGRETIPFQFEKNPLRIHTQRIRFFVSNFCFFKLSARIELVLSRCLYVDSIRFV